MLNVACCTLQAAQLCSDCDYVVDYCGRARGGSSSTRERLRNRFKSPASTTSTDDTCFLFSAAGRFLLAVSTDR